MYIHKKKRKEKLNDSNVNFSTIACALQRLANHVRVLHFLFNVCLPIAFLTYFFCIVYVSYKLSQVISRKKKLLKSKKKKKRKNPAPSFGSHSNPQSVIHSLADNIMFTRHVDASCLRREDVFKNDQQFN